jgi:hypothetical protein
MNKLIDKHGGHDAVLARIGYDVLESEAEAQLFSESDTGFCVACGEAQGGCEPDAEGYTCDACGESAVCGASELFMVFA